MKEQVRFGKKNPSASKKTRSSSLPLAVSRLLNGFEDDGVSGWKRGAKRPDFTRMLSEVKQLGAQAIVCDNLDRFSKAAFDEVHADAAELRQAGVRWIVTASHGDFDLGKRHDIGELLKFVAAVWSCCEYSRQLGRRIATCSQKQGN